jgi:hypothetical protein
MALGKSILVLGFPFPDPFARAIDDSVKICVRDPQSGGFGCSPIPFEGESTTPLPTSPAAAQSTGDNWPWWIDQPYTFPAAYVTSTAAPITPPAPPPKAPYGSIPLSTSSAPPLAPPPSPSAAYGGSQTTKALTLPASSVTPATTIPISAPSIAVTTPPATSPLTLVPPIAPTPPPYPEFSEAKTITVYVPTTTTKTATFYMFETAPPITVTSTSTFSMFQTLPPATVTATSTFYMFETLPPAYYKRGDAVPTTAH